MCLVFQMDVLDDVNIDKRSAIERDNSSEMAQFI